MEKPKYSINKERLHERQAALETIRKRLKSDFVGIDDIIDNLLDYIQVWYLMPEILTRPIIVCLWGMTGVGKTDLVRRMVRYLDFQERFAEVELGNSDGTTYYSSVNAIIKAHNMTDNQPSIVLFDEIQRFYTIEPDGSPVPMTKFADFWELLSDGRLARREREDFDWYVQEYRLNQRKRARRQPGDPEEEDPMLESIGLWEARRLKELLSFDDEVVDLADLNKLQMLDRIMDAKKRKKVYEPVDYSQMLIIISGNLDEAFQMATQTSDSEVNADIYHAFTKKITAVDIKNALTRRFRPEQVARFGNIHIIYPSLRRVDFERLIQKEVGKIVDRTQEKFGVEITISDDVYALIYRNGVFPVQGVRPVFSSVTDILETHLSKFLFEALTTDCFSIAIGYDNEKKCITGAITGGKTVVIPFVGRIDKIRQGNIGDVVANVSVHEAGHAVAYICLFGLAPLQLKSKVASSYASGFTFPHEIYETKDSILKKIMVFLAGGLAEETIFGENHATVGRLNDREQAAMMAMDYVRRYGFDPRYQSNYSLEFGWAMDKFKTDPDIEQMLAGLVMQTRQLLEQHRTFLTELSVLLMEKGSLEAAEVAKVAARFDLTAEIKAEGYLHTPGYGEKLS